MFSPPWQTCRSPAGLYNEKLNVYLYTAFLANILWWKEITQCSAAAAAGFFKRLQPTAYLMVTAELHLFLSFWTILINLHSSFYFQQSVTIFFAILVLKPRFTISQNKAAARRKNWRLKSPTFVMGRNNVFSWESDGFIKEE